MSLLLSARQRDMLSFMGLPMQGWPLEDQTPTTPAIAGEAAPSAMADLGQSAPRLLVDTMDPAVRKLSLRALKAGGGADGAVDGAVDGADAIAASVPAISPELDQPKTEVALSPQDASSVVWPPALWSLDGQCLTQLHGAQVLLLCEAEHGGADFPLDAEASALLRNILQALDWPVEHWAIAAVHGQAAQDEAQLQARWLAQLRQWQPQALLLLGRYVCQHVLPGQAQAQGLNAMRGQTHYLAGLPARVSYPLRYLLRNPQAKAKAWQDWLQLRWALL